MNSDVLCPSVVVDGEDGDVAVVDNVVSSVEPLSNVDDSNVDDVKEGHSCSNMLFELSL